MVANGKRKRASNVFVLRRKAFRHFYEFYARPFAKAVRHLDRRVVQPRSRDRALKSALSCSRTYVDFTVAAFWEAADPSMTKSVRHASENSDSVAAEQRDLAILSLASTSRRSRARRVRPMRAESWFQPSWLARARRATSECYVYEEVAQVFPLRAQNCECAVLRICPDLRSISRTEPLLSFVEQFTLCERALGTCICEGEHYVRTCCKTCWCFRE
jgi:hypothetical protein